MTLRFGIPTLLIIAPLVYTNPFAILYLLAAVGVGALYPVREKIYNFLKLSKLRNKYIDIDSIRMMEFIAGVSMLGGLSLL